jgi:hypothetical protein
VSGDLTTLWQGLAAVPAQLDAELGETVALAQHDAAAAAPRRTGRLAASVFTARAGAAGYLLGAHASYAAFVSYGTKRMRANPYLAVAIARNLRTLGTRLRQKAGNP